MDAKTALTYTLGTLFVCLAVVAIVFLIAQGIMHGDALNAEVKRACVEAGGTWINTNSICIGGSE